MRTLPLVPTLRVGTSWILLAAWAGCASATHGADADLAKSYDYRIILRVAPHRLLTQAFRRQLRDELQDGVQAALGSLAQVDVVNADASEVKDWLDPTTLDAHSEIGPAKRHFVEVSFADGRYVIRARQHDGSTGLASPLVREARTPDRQIVGRLIMQFIDQDFGPVGTVTAFDKATDRAELAFRGGASAPDKLARFVPAGSVFALARIQGSPARGRTLDAAYLVALAEPKDGRCECRFVYRYQDQLTDWSAVTYRALKLGAGQGPIRLRLVEPNGLPAQGVQVRVSPDGFQPRTIRDQGAVRDGAFNTAHDYDRLAYVVISAGEQSIAQIPVPVIDDRVTTCRVTTLPGGEARQQIELDARNVRQRLVDILRRLEAQKVRLEREVELKNHADTLMDVKRALDVLDGELTGLSAELGRLQREKTPLDSGVGPMLDECDVFLREVRKRQERLRRDQTDLENALDDEKKQQPKRDNILALLRRASEQREEAQFDEALQTYDEILAQYGERKEVREKRDQLQEAWKIKSEEQRAARAFAYGAWAGIRTADDVRENLPKARTALETCKKVGDRLTPLKLLLAAPAASDALQKAVEEIEKGDSDADKINLTSLRALIGELQAFIKDVSAYVRPDEKKP